MRIFEPNARWLLRRANIEVNTSEHFSIHVNNPRVYRRVALGGTLGIGEAYMDGDWDCHDLAEFFYRVTKIGLEHEVKGIPGRLHRLLSALYNLQSPARAKMVAEHYNTSVDLFEKMLDSRMVYTCAYFERGATTLACAQEDKLQLVCEKLDLKEGERVLDIGCGFGSFAKYAAERYGVKVVGIGNATDQLEKGRELCAELANGTVELIDLDYREAQQRFGMYSFDKIVSIGMFEAVGPKNFCTFMAIVRGLLKPGGIFVLHTITSRLGGADPWLNRYIFPNGYIPAEGALDGLTEDFFDSWDKHSIGPNYDRTLCVWEKNFEEAWSYIRWLGFDERFRRMWRYYLLQCAGMFRSGALDVQQYVLSTRPKPEGYVPIR